LEIDGDMINTNKITEHRQNWINRYERKVDEGIFKNRFKQKEARGELERDGKDFIAYTMKMFFYFNF
jgi:hypothetical protein